jgi:4-diphosphocytidyl-2-C-methyl-D-erythritol kinase
MIRFPNAKINLGLKVLDKRADGFHNIETVLYPVEQCDILEILPSEGKETSFTCSGLEIPGDPEDNLCLKAYHLLTSGFHLPIVRIHLHKVIPIGAGLGGGSSDGAYTIKLLNELFAIGLSDQEMTDLASQLGSDCAFFIRNKPVYAYEKGDRFIPVDIDLSGFRIKIITPDININTKKAYRMMDDAMAHTGTKPGRRRDDTEREMELTGLSDKTDTGKISEVILKPIQEWRYRLFNDFEQPICQQYPVIRTIKDRFYDEGAVYVSMSGSGSSVYAIFI